MSKKLPETLVLSFMDYPEFAEWADDMAHTWAIRQVVELTCSGTDLPKFVVVFEER